MAVAGATLALVGCTDRPADDAPGEAEVQAQATDPTFTPISQLPLIDATANQKILGELLGKPTAAGETTALYVRLADTDSSPLKGTMLRVIGSLDNPQVLFRADALAQLGLIDKSPGKDFFVAFATLDPQQLSVIQRNEAQIASGVFGKPTNESVVVAGRSIVGRINNPTIDPTVFRPGGGGVPINACALRPGSTQQAWDQALFIRDPAVVQDTTRTWDPCTGLGTPGGVWTFAHLMREMANGSGQTPETFVKDWLSNWLNNYTVNGDVVAARTQMFDQVIRPWEIASGGSATLVTNPMTGVRSVTLTVPLNLDIAPFELEAIVNRIDLGDTADGPSGYSGTITSLPVTAGELRFIFDVVQPSGGSCGKKLFTTIFEYGVPGTGCNAVVDWARKWTSLQTMSGFTATYLGQLQAMTESVVLHGSAPAKGNQNAINQIRTNEVALGLPVGITSWELREFTLTNEIPSAGTNAPISGELRTHTVALTPNDAAFPPTPGNATVTSFMSTLTLTLPLSIPTQCNANLAVPFFTPGGAPFRGGNALIGSGHWNMIGLTTASSAHDICARHLVSLNTCHGCHRDDSSTTGAPAGNTSFTHVNATGTIPVTLSKFLTAAGPNTVFNVPDPQLGSAVMWPFNDLQRRYDRLYDISHCTSCLIVRGTLPPFISQIQQLGPVPADPGPDTKLPFQTGPFTNLDGVKKLFDLRTQFLGDPVSQNADFIRTAQTFSH